MSIELYIKEQVKNLCSKVYVAPEIPDKKMNGAIVGMTSGVDPDHVLAIADTTLFGSAKEGCLFTGENLYIHSIGSKKIEICLSDIERANYIVTEITNDKGKVKETKHVIILLKDGTEVNLTNDLIGIDKKVFCEMLNDISVMGRDEDDFKNTSQSTPLSMMEPEIKKAYVKILCNFAYSDDNKISPEEYAAIISLIVRVELRSDDRIQIRGYMLNQESISSSESLIGELKMNLRLEQFELVKKSLIKDVLHLNRTTNRDKQWQDHPYILTLQNLLEINDQQMETINEAIINDEEILKMRKNDSEIEKAMKDIASKAAAVGVPLAAIYLSGSVVGVSAAGITSGLAALGMKGLLGFSSMFTGIGVAVLIGIGTYKGLKKITGISDLENNKQRELMLQEIIINSQKTLNIMVEDVNTISAGLNEAIKDQSLQKEKIKKLTVTLGMLSKGSKVASDRVNYAETEKIIATLPQRLDETRLIELTNTPTTSKYRDIVLSYYIKKDELLDDGSEKTNYYLNDQIPTDDLRNLGKILEAIGYNKVGNASLATLKGSTKKLMNNLMGELYEEGN